MLQVIEADSRQLYLGYVDGLWVLILQLGISFIQQCKKLDLTVRITNTLLRLGLTCSESDNMTPKLLGIMCILLEQFNKVVKPEYESPQQLLTAPN